MALPNTERIELGKELIKKILEGNEKEALEQINKSDNDKRLGPRISSFYFTYDKKEYFPLYAALKMKQNAVALALLKKGASPFISITQENGKDLLLYAIEQDASDEVINEIIKWYKTNNMNERLQELIGKYDTAAAVKTGSASSVAAPPAVSVPAPHVKSEKIGEGSFGQVFSPAVLNSAMTPEQQQQTVTKFFADESDYKTALEKAKIVQQIFSPYDVKPYTKQLTTSNLPAGLKGAGPFYAIKMPNLGINLDDVSKLVKKPTIPIPIILGQITKCIEKLYLINLRGYLHMDIKTLNIVMDTNTGVITIIDFDTLALKTVKIEDSKLPFIKYWHPPEVVLYDNHDYDYNSFAYFFKYVSEGDTSIKPIQQEFDAIANKNNEYLRLKPKMIETFDSFGLAWAFLKLLTSLYPNSTDPNIVAMKETVLKPLGAFKQGERKTLAEVYQTAVDIVRAAQAAAPAVGGYRRRSRSKRKSPKRSSRSGNRSTPR